MLRALRQVRQKLGGRDRSRTVDAALVAALDAVRMLDIPHFDPPEDETGGVVH